MRYRFVRVGISKRLDGMEPERRLFDISVKFNLVNGSNASLIVPINVLSFNRRVSCWKRNK